MPEISNTMLKAIRRKKGELNINVLTLSEITGVSRWTLDKILSGERTTVRTETVKKINNWIYRNV